MAKTAARTFIRDERDTEKKCSAVRGMAHNNPALALRMAQAIASDISLLKGLTQVVVGLVKHEQARAVLLEVFNRPGLKEKYSHAFSVVQKAHIEHAVF